MQRVTMVRHVTSYSLPLCCLLPSPQYLPPHCHSLPCPPLRPPTRLQPRALSRRYRAPVKLPCFPPKNHCGEGYDGWLCIPTSYTPCGSEGGRKCVHVHVVAGRAYAASCVPL